MKITVLHSKDALDPPVDPILDQLDAALTANGHTIRISKFCSNRIRHTGTHGC